MLHEPAPPSEARDNASDIKARLGVRLFIFYCIVYAGFVVINTFWPTALGAPGLFGADLAVTYGFGLIVLAIVLGMIYNAICTRHEKRMNVSDEGMR